MRFEQPERLELSPEDMRALGYRVIDQLVDHFAALPELPVIQIGTPEDLQALFQDPFPEDPQPAQEVFTRVTDDVFANMMHTTHPRFLAYVPSPSNFISVLADALVAGYNPFAGTWMEASGPAQVELVMIDWLRRLFDFPPGAGGVFTSGGSLANFTGLAVARPTCLGDAFHDAVIYASDQTHASLARGVRLLGFKSRQYRIIPSDENFRLPLDALRELVAADLASGLRPFCVVANAGTTNSGAVDPLPELVEYCRSKGLWLHVDGAYGGAAALTEAGSRILAGLEGVDSLVIDPHKWLFQPYELGCLLVRDREQLLKTFQYFPEYLQDLAGTAEAVNFSDYGPQLTRSFRALKLWMSLNVFGVTAFRKAVQRGFALAEYAQNQIEGLEKLAIHTPAQLGVLTFRYQPKNIVPEDLNRFSRDLVEAIIADRFAMVSSTKLRGETVLRLCTINPRTSEVDLTEVLERIVFLGEKLEAAEYP